jgi:ribosomal protein S18 acetylase RimI-like enzyme
MSSSWPPWHCAPPRRTTSTSSSGCTRHPWVRTSTQIWGWDDDEQRAFFGPNLRLDHVEVITVDEDDDEVFIGLIELLPSQQGQGIGTGFIREILDRAAADGKRVRLNVLAANVDAYRLYRRLGFTEVGRDVDGPATRIRMIGP